MPAHHRSRASRLAVLAVALSALASCAVLAAPSTASAQLYGGGYIDLSGLDGLTRLDRSLSDVGDALEAMSFVTPAIAGSAMFLGGLVGELAHSGRQVWFVANTVFGILTGLMAAAAFNLALDHEDSPRRSTRLGYGSYLTCTSLANLAIAIILRVDLDDEFWPRAIALEDVHGQLAPGVGFGAAF